MPGLSPGGEDGSEAVRRHVWVSGRVQNVWFRDGCAREAQANDVSGWATNLPDGRVEVVLEGSANAVGVVEAWCGHGPTRARVTAVEARDEPVRGERGFAIG